MGNFKVYTIFNKTFGSNCSFCLKMPNLRPWKSEPSPRPHPHFDPTINKHTEQVTKLCMDLSWHALNSVIRDKTLYHTEKQGFGHPLILKWFQTHPLNPLKLNPVWERSAYILKNCTCFSPPTSVLQSFGHKSTPSDRSSIESYCPKF